MKQLRQYIKNIILEYHHVTKDTGIAPPPRESIEELNKVIFQYNNRYNPEHLQHDLDVQMEVLFDDVIKNAGYESMEETIKDIKEQPSNVVLKLKNIYRRQRPDTVAKSFGVDWSGDGVHMGTDDTFAYPSGHTCQAYFIALNLSDIYPELKQQFFDIAEMVAQSRVDRGVHFPSDLDAGRDLAFKLYNQKENLQ